MINSLLRRSHPNTSSIFPKGTENENPVVIGGGWTRESPSDSSGHYAGIGSGPIPGAIRGAFVESDLNPGQIIQIDSLTLLQVDRGGDRYPVTYYAVKYFTEIGKVVSSRPMPGWYDEIRVKVLGSDPVDGMRDAGDGAPVWVSQKEARARRTLRITDAGDAGAPFAIYAGASPVGIEMFAYVPAAGGQWIIGKCFGPRFRIHESSDTHFANVREELVREANAFCNDRRDMGH